MTLIGEFHKVEIDGKPYLVYHEIPLPQIHSPNPSHEITSIEKPLSQFQKTLAVELCDELALASLYICPYLRYRLAANAEKIKIKDEDGSRIPDVFFKLKTFPLIGNSVRRWYGHSVLPLLWCNNKEADPDNDCGICRSPNVGTVYYFCDGCNLSYHKECVESPPEINYPSHVKHSLQLYYSHKINVRCILCRIKTGSFLYYCATCDIYMHVYCAQAAIPFFIDQPKRHDHTLTLFPRQDSLTCNICGLVNKNYLTYVCRSVCDFVAHNDCIYIPQTIRISRHHHRVSFTSSLPLGKWFCGVCRQEVDSDYGAYTCNVCSGYVVHTRCALRKDIWDGIELEGVPEEEEDPEPFERIDDGIILHFSHGCHMKLVTYGVYDEMVFCQACMLPIDEETFYVCFECDFILHETCANAPRKKVHPLHPHTLKQRIVHVKHTYQCVACNRWSTGFAYGCTKETCRYILDPVCASVSEPFNYQGHQHPLFLALDPNEKPMCHICKSTKVKKVLNCIECDFIICFECATLPYMVRYKHDDHYLKFCHGDEASGSDWCELCEGKLAIGVGGKEGFYKCNDCCTTLHISCLLGPHPYLKPGPPFPVNEGEMLIQHNTSLSRAFCDKCEIRCPYPVFYIYSEETIFYLLCSYPHVS